MIALASSVLVASLVGSLHCAGMCGGIAACAGGVGECAARRSALASAIYHASRGFSYAVVGALAGALGQAVDSGGMLVGVQRVAAIAAGLLVALVGVALLARAGGAGAVAGMPAPEWVSRAVAGIHRRALRLPPPQRAAAIGLASVLLPCGWLWAFAAVAAGTGAWWQGATVMVAFWIGTVPVLAALGAGIASLGGARRRWVTALAGAAMIAVGMHTAFVRAPLAAHALAAARTQGVQPASLRADMHGDADADAPPPTRDMHAPARGSSDARVALPAGTPACCQRSEAPANEGGPSQ